MPSWTSQATSTRPGAVVCSPIAAAAVVPGGSNVDQLGGGGAAVVADRGGGDLAELAALDVGHVAQEHTAVSGSPSAAVVVWATSTRPGARAIGPPASASIVALRSSRRWQC